MDASFIKLTKNIHGMRGIKSTDEFNKKILEFAVRVSKFCADYFGEKDKKYETKGLVMNLYATLYNMNIYEGFEISGSPMEDGNIKDFLIDGFDIMLRKENIEIGNIDETMSVVFI